MTGDEVAKLVAAHLREGDHLRDAIDAAEFRLRMWNQRYIRLTDALAEGRKGEHAGLVRALRILEGLEAPDR